jgi:hypothetical protein
LLTRLAEIRQQIFSNILPETFHGDEDDEYIAVVKWTSGSILPLLLNHQCYYEALYVLYGKREFFMFISDAEVTVRPRPRCHAAVPTPSYSTTSWLPDSGIALISNLSIHVFVKSLEDCCIESLRQKIKNLVRTLTGRPMVILRIKVTFSPRASLSPYSRDGFSDEKQAMTRARLILTAFEGVKARRVFVELQGHWRGPGMGEWSKELKDLVST